jgi:hypothetical protein
MSKLDSLPKYKQFVIPYVVLVKDGIPQLKINDDRKTEVCIQQKLCSVCGQPLNGDMWMIGLFMKEVVLLMYLYIKNVEFIV